MSKDKTKRNTAYFHLPGLFEFYELYRRFLPLFYTHREYFYDWCEIGSVYGAPEDCLWGGGRVEAGEADPEGVFTLTQEYGISRAKRPFNGRLDKSKLVENGFALLPDWEDALKRYLEEIDF